MYRNCFLFIIQAGAWPIPQSNLPTFALPQELEKSVHMVCFEVFAQLFKRRVIVLVTNQMNGVICELSVTLLRKRRIFI